MSNPLLLPLVAVIAGILLGRGFEVQVPEALAAALALAVLAILSHVKAGPILTRATTLAALVFSGAAIAAWHRPGPTPELDAGARETVLLEGCVVEPSVFSMDREQFTLELDTLPLVQGARARVSLALEDGDTGDLLSYGQRVQIQARVRPPHNFNNPGGFDYVWYLARQKIFWTASMTRGTRARVLPGRCGSRIMAGVFALRTAAIERIEQLYPQDASPGGNYLTGMMEGVLIGETSKLDRAWTEDFRRTGTFHALVISGVHVTVLAGVLLFLLRLALMPEMAALTATASAAWLYAMVSGFSAPVVRAAGGFTLYLIARFFFRRARVLNMLAAVALVYVAWDPDQLFDASFQLSFLSVAAIGALAMPLIESSTAPLARAMRGISNLRADGRMEPRAAQLRVEVRLAAETAQLFLNGLLPGTRMPLRWSQQMVALSLRAVFFAFEMAALSAVIQIGLALPMAEYFHRVSFTGLTANLLIVPALDAVIPIGFVAVFTGWHWVGAVAGGFLTFAAKVAAWHANLEPAWRVPDPPPWLAVSFVAALIALALVARRRVLRWPTGLAVLGLFALLLWQPPWQRWPSRVHPGQLELTAIDVGQGDSLLLQLPRGQTMLIDAGGLLQFGRVRKSNLDIGEDVVSPYLWSRGIRRIDVLVATHAHQDHIGGLTAVLTNFRPRELWAGANFPSDVLDQARRLGVRVIEPHAGPTFEIGGVGFQVLSPPADYQPSKPGSPGNNDSLALRLTYGSRSFLLTGDMEKPMEARLLLDTLADHPDGLHADVLKVGHHGSKTSTIEPFLQAVSPSVALISAGYENSFGHPHPDVVARLNTRHTAILRTDLDGRATVLTDGQRLEFEIESWRPGLSPARLPALRQ
ncbi:MAG TPA: ComEC/Rec2 family competence protein [Bryobacteraceae bacterium]|nr:ComEC/Rec2 family competence protein [Bryobacteraceae bacterium]